MHCVGVCPLNGMSNFSEKVATLAGYQYDGVSKGAQWRLLTRHHLVSKEPILDVIFKHVEAHEGQQTTFAMLAQAGVGIDLVILKKLAGDVWGYLALCVKGGARLWVNNPAILEGFDLWRRVWSQCNHGVRFVVTNY